MEAQIQTPEISTPPQVAPPQPVVEAPTQVAPPAPASGSFEDGGAFEGKTPMSGKYKMIDIFIMALWIVVPIYGIVYYRKAIKKLDEQPSIDELDNINDNLEEVTYNVKKLMGNKYIKT